MSTLNYQIKLFSREAKKEFNDFINHHQYGSPLQFWEWSQVKSSPSWKAIHLGIFQGNRLLGTAQILKRLLPLGLSIFYCPRGPVLDWNSAESTNQLAYLLSYIKQKYTSPAILVLRLEPPIPSDQSHRLAQPPLLPYFKSIQPAHTSIIDLTFQREALLNQMDKDTRYGIRRAAREGVIVVKDPGTNLDNWKSFYQMYQKTAQKGFTPRPWRQFEKIFQYLAPVQQAELYLSLLPRTRKRINQEVPLTLTDQIPENSILLAGAIVLKTQRLGCYLWGASVINEQTKKLYAPYLLQWEIMQSLKNEGINKYDLWGIAPTDDPKHAWSGHTLFKKGFGGKRVDYAGCYDLPLSPFYRIYRNLDYFRQKKLQPDLIERK